MKKDREDDVRPARDNTDVEDRVGYGKPPRRTRFRPGQSGNRKGRPKGAEGLKTIVKRVAGEKHRIVEQGKVRWRTNLELVLMSLSARALKGDVKAFQVWHDLLVRYGAEERNRIGACVFCMSRDARGARKGNRKIRES